MLTKNFQQPQGVAGLIIIINFKTQEYGIVKDSVILLEQVRTIDKSRLREKVCHLDESVMRRINQGLEVSLALRT